MAASAAAGRCSRSSAVPRPRLASLQSGRSRSAMSKAFSAALGLAETEQGEAPVEMRLGEARLQPRGALIGHHRLVGPPHRLQRVAAVEMRQRIGGAKRDRPVEGGERLVDAGRSPEARRPGCNGPPEIAAPAPAPRRRRRAPRPACRRADRRCRGCSGRSDASAPSSLRVSSRIATRYLPAADQPGRGWPERLPPAPALSGPCLAGLFIDPP